jgi:hypothetical protein
MRMTFSHARAGLTEWLCDRLQVRLPAHAQAGGEGVPEVFPAEARDARACERRAEHQAVEDVAVEGTGVRGIRKYPRAGQPRRQAAQDR